MFLLQWYIVHCLCLANESSSIHLPKIISKKNGVSKQFSVAAYNQKKIHSTTETSPKTASNAGRLASMVKFPSAMKNIDIKEVLDFQEIQSIAKNTFLPIGFPDKTPHGYLSFSIWSWIQDLSTQLRAILATQRVLEGVGVGREGATALSASINFIVRDGCGMASTLLFTASASDKFKSNVKKWRLFADIMNDVGITLEVAATLVPKNLFLPMICK